MEGNVTSFRIGRFRDQFRRLSVIVHRARFEGECQSEVFSTQLGSKPGALLSGCRQAG